MSKANTDQAQSNSSSAPDDNRRPIRSFVIRGGRLTHSQRRALENFWQEFGVDYPSGIVNSPQTFSNQAELVVEIGFGMGDSLLQMATDNPHLNYIGIEVHKPGIGKLLQGLAERQLTNVKIICHDAKEILAHSFADQSIEKIQIFFPDPWPKKRHHKRRLIQTEFTQLLVQKLKPNGQIHLATDWQEYADHMLEVLTAEQQLNNAAGAGQFWQQKQRPITKFERRGQRFGHGVWDLLFTRVLP